MTLKIQKLIVFHFRPIQHFIESPVTSGNFLLTKYQNICFTSLLKPNFNTSWEILISTTENVAMLSISDNVFAIIDGV
jgi:hypothetical protein